LFVAVFPPPDEIGSLRRALPASAPLTNTDKWHVTLVFLGEVAEERVEEVAGILRAVPVPGRFSLRLGGSGRFGAVAWAAVGGDLEALGVLRATVKDALDARGFRSDDRPFTPHLTVSYDGDEPTRRALADYAGTSWVVSEFALVSSRDGAYEQLHSWPTGP
jgi:RNA 2',3'-cyclic 3'-phosphodiesterase